MHEKITILDFGSQYSQLIARRVRELAVYSELLPCTAQIEQFADGSLKGIILSGGPASVLEPGAPDVDEKIFSLGVPILGICYGMQLIAQKFGGELLRAKRREYGPAILQIEQMSDLFNGTHGNIFAGIPDNVKIWMSHGDNIERIPEGFVKLGNTDTLPLAAMANFEKRIYAVQFHPEVRHTEFGMKMLENFVRKICACKDKWDLGDYAQHKINEIREMVGKDERVVLAYSGGVDSTVVAAMLIKAVGERLVPIAVDNGLCRKDEIEEIRTRFKKVFGFEPHIAYKSELFLSKLRGIEDPEKKRKKIGITFIEVFQDEALAIKNAKWLAQGTLYPDVIESVSFKGPSATIKTHHNVGGLPEKLGFK